VPLLRMGCVSTKTAAEREQEAIDADIARKTKTEVEKERAVIKLLFLGACRAPLREGKEGRGVAGRGSPGGRGERSDTSWRSVRAGAGESGKSTLFKQLRLIYGNAFSKEEREQKVRVVHGNVVEGIKTLVERAGDLGHPVRASVREQRSVGNRWEGERGEGGAEGAGGDGGIPHALRRRRRPPCRSWRTRPR
jgi:hypothetical protein